MVFLCRRSTIVGDMFDTFFRVHAKVAADELRICNFKTAFQINWKWLKILSWHAQKSSFWVLPDCVFSLSSAMRRRKVSYSRNFCLMHGMVFVLWLVLCWLKNFGQRLIRDSVAKTSCHLLLFPWIAAWRRVTIFLPLFKVRVINYRNSGKNCK